MIFWGNAFGNRPTGYGTATNLVCRASITFGLAVATFVAYYYVLAEHVLHEPVVAGALHGNALGFLDWFALVTLLYVVGFGSYPLRAPEATPDTDARADADPGVVLPDAAVTSAG
jgi:AAT family amino acid transporter